MKQKVDQEIYSLSKSATKVLYDWLQEHDYSVYEMTIGQMIEFLYEESEYKLEWPSYLKFTGDEVRGYAYKGTPFICDDLWEAVKEILNTL